MFEQLQEMLYSEGATEQVRDGLLALQRHPDFDCGVDYLYYRFFPNRAYCPAFYYTLGLAYELSGEEKNAVNTYWQLWRDYPESPFSQIAQFKLEKITP